MVGFVFHHTSVSLSEVRQGMHTDTLGTCICCHHLAVHQPSPFLSGLKHVCPWHIMMPCIGHFGARQRYDVIHAATA